MRQIIEKMTAMSGMVESNGVPSKDEKTISRVK